MEVTLAGMVTEVREVQPQKAESPMAKLGIPPCEYRGTGTDRKGQAEKGLNPSKNEKTPAIARVLRWW
jgi:hypothetical protein